MAYCRTALLVHLIFCLIQLLISCTAEPPFASAGTPVSSRRKKPSADRTETGSAGVVRGDNQKQVEHGHGMTSSLTKAAAAAAATTVTTASSASVRSLRGSGQRSGWLYSCSGSSGSSWSSSRNNRGRSRGRRRALSDLAPTVGPSAGGAVFFGAADPPGSGALPASTSLAHRDRCR